MAFRNVLLLCCAAIVITFGLVHGCKNTGTEPPPQLPPGFGVSENPVCLLASMSLPLTISGGTQPYVIVDSGNTTVAAVSISGTTLTIQGIAAGSDTVVIGDNGSPQLLVNINITVSTVSFLTQIQPIFTNNCVNAGCHPGGGAPFSLESGQSYGNLVNVTSTASPSCSGQLRVKPFSATESVLYRRISGTTCGSRMPLGGGSLSPTNQNLIRDWINQGACSR